MRSSALEPLARAVPPIVPQHDGPRIMIVPTPAPGEDVYVQAHPTTGTNIIIVPSSQPQERAKKGEKDKADVLELWHHVLVGTAVTVAFGAAVCIVWEVFLLR